MGKSPLEGYQSHPPPHHVENPWSLHVEKARMQDANAGRRREIQTWNWDAERGGEGENNELINRSTFRRRILNEDSYYPSSPYCVDKMCLSPFGVAGKQKPLPIKWGQCLYKGAQASSKSSVDYTTFNRQHLCEEWCIKNKVSHSNTRGTVSLCYFSRWITAAHSLHFQHLIWTRGYRFKTSTVKRSLC